MLAIYTGRGVVPEVNLGECISHTPPQNSNKAEPTLALKPRGDITRSPKQGYQWPQNGHVSNKNFLKKKQKQKNPNFPLTFIPLGTTSNLFPLEVVKNHNIAYFVYYGKTRIDLDLTD